MTASAPIAGAGEAPAFSPGYLRYALAIIFLINVVNVADRSIMGVLLESIREEMELSDTQIGLLSGLAFALFYAVAGIFLARVSDLYDRRIVLSVSVFIWSCMTALTGAVNSFGQFFLARMGVGIGEASAVPTSNAMIADYFPPTQRSLALAIFIAGSFLGVLAGSALGGYVGQHYGWRWAFVAAAVPGIPLALITLLTLRDPPRGGSDGIKEEGPPPSLGQTLAAMLGNTTFLFLIPTVSCTTFILYGLTSWLPTFLMRGYGLDQQTVGLFFGTALGIGTSIGSVAGGLLANRLARSSLIWLPRLPFLLSFLLLPLYQIAVHAPDATTSLVFIALSSTVGGAMVGPVLATIQTVLPPRMRATGASISGFFGSLIGLGLAPLVVGMLSDHFKATMASAEALRWALSISLCLTVLLTLLLFFASRSFARRLAS